MFKSRLNLHWFLNFQIWGNNIHLSPGNLTTKYHRIQTLDIVGQYKLQVDAFEMNFPSTDINSDHRSILSQWSTLHQSLGPPTTPRTCQLWQEMRTLGPLGCGDQPHDIGCSSLIVDMPFSNPLRLCNVFVSFYDLLCITATLSWNRILCFRKIPTMSPRCRRSGIPSHEVLPWDDK